MAKSTSLMVAALIAFCTSNFAQGALIVEFNFNDQNGTADIVHPDANAVTPVFTPGSGLLGPNFTASNARARRWNTASAATAIAGGRFWEFTVTADPGLLLDLQNLTFSDVVGANGPTGFQLEVNGTLFGSPSATGSGANIDLSSLGLLSAYTFRIAGFGGLNNGFASMWTIDNVQLNGAVVPEPSALLLAFALMIPGVVYVRRTRFAKPQLATVPLAV